MSQTIIEVEAKPLDDSTVGERRQARLPRAGRGPAIQEDVPGRNLTLANHHNGTSRGLYQRDRESTMTGAGSVGWPSLVEHKQCQRCRLVVAV
jgi:hypothetical protein